MIFSGPQSKLFEDNDGLFPKIISKLVSYTQYTEYSVTI